MRHVSPSISLSPYLSFLPSLLRTTAVFAHPLSYREDKPSAYAVINRAASSPPAGLNDFSRPVIPLVALSVTLPNPSGIDNPIDCRMLSTHPTSCGREEGGWRRSFRLASLRCSILRNWTWK